MDIGVVGDGSSVTDLLANFCLMKARYFITSGVILMILPSIEGLFSYKCVDWGKTTRESIVNA